MNKRALDEEVKPPTGRPQHNQYSSSTALPKMDFLLAPFTHSEEEQGEGREEGEGEREDEKGERKGGEGGKGEKKDEGKEEEEW